MPPQTQPPTPTPQPPLQVGGDVHERVTSKDLAARLKNKFPQLSRYSDDSVVESFLSKNPDYRQYVDYKLSLPGNMSIEPPAPFYKRAGAKIGRAMPAAGATLGAVVSSPGMASTVGGALLGGAGGKALEQLIDRAIGMHGLPSTSGEAAKQIAVEGGEQAAMQATGEAFGKYVPWAKLFPGGRVAGGDVTAQELRDMSNTPGLRLSAGEVRGAPRGTLREISGLGMWSEKASEKYAEQTAKSASKMADEFLGTLTPPVGREQSGIWLKGAIDNSSKAFKKEGERLFSQFRGASGVAIPTDFNSLVTLANKIEAEHTPLVQRTGGISPLPDQSPAGQLINTIQHLSKGPQNFDTAMQMRDYISRYLPGGDRQFADRESESIAKRMWSTLSGQLDKDAATAGVGTQWKEAREFWRTGRQQFDSRIIKGVIKKNPEVIADSIKPGDVTDTRTLKQTLFDYPRTIRNPQERAMALKDAQKAWSGLQRTFAERRIIGNPAEKSFTLSDFTSLKSRMEKLGPEQLNEMYGDPRGQAFLGNMRTFAELMSRTDMDAGLRLGRFRVLYDIVGILGSAGTGVYQRDPLAAVASFGALEGIPRLLSAVMHDKTATDLLLRSIISPPSSKALAASVSQRIVKYAVEELQSDDKFDEGKK